MTSTSMFSRGRPSLEERVAFVEERLFEAMVEIEALRRTLLETEQARGRYARAYRSTSLDSHNSAGPTDGVQKIVWCWDGEWGDGVREAVKKAGAKHPWVRAHEWAMLARLGLTPEEIAAHIARVEEVSSYT